MANTKIKKEKVERRGSIANECRDIKIFNLCQEGYSRDQLAEMYSLKPQTISHILGNIDYNLKHGFYSNYSEHPEYQAVAIQAADQYTRSYRWITKPVFIWRSTQNSKYWYPYQFKLHIILNYTMINIDKNKLSKAMEKDRASLANKLKVRKEDVVPISELLSDCMVAYVKEENNEQ